MRSEEQTIVVAGPGALGCLLAALLHRNGRAVTLLDKNAERARTLNAKGIRLESAVRPLVLPMMATTDFACVRDAEAVLICVKSYDARALLECVAPHLAPETVVVSFQNGLGHDDLLREHVGASRSVCAVTGEGATALDVGRIVHAGRGRTRVAPLDSRDSQAGRRATDLLQEAGMDAVFDTDVRRTLWSKLVVSVGINPVTALADVPNGALLDRPDLFARAQAAAEEACAVAGAAGVTLPEPDAVGTLRRVCRNTAANLSSMLQDVRKGKRTEIEALNGAVVREGRRLGVPTPVNGELRKEVLARFESDFTLPAPRP